MKSRTPLVVTIAVSAGLALALTPPSAALAHVEVEPNTAEASGFTRVDISALNESATASTIRVEFQLPTDTPILNVTYNATPGWTTTIVKETLPKPVMIGATEITAAPTKIIFEAEDGKGIRPGAFQLWTVSMGPIPETERIVFPSIQTYDDGEVVEWVATPEELEADPTLKAAPVLYIGNDPAAGDGKRSNDETSSSRGSADSSDAVARALSVSALVLGASGVVLGGAAAARRRMDTKQFQ